MILVTNPIINFVFYETIKKNFSQKGFWQIFVASSIGKLLATFATYPYLTIRSKLHSDRDLKESYVKAFLRVVNDLSTVKPVEANPDEPQRYTLLMARWSPFYRGI